MHILLFTDIQTVPPGEQPEAHLDLNLGVI